MSMMIAALALAAAQTPQTSPAAPADDARQHQQGQKHDGCCCKKMAEGGKMECCAKHGEGHGQERGAHSAH